MSFPLELDVAVSIDPDLQPELRPAEEKFHLLDSTLLESDEVFSVSQMYTKLPVNKRPQPQFAPLQPEDPVPASEVINFTESADPPLGYVENEKELELEHAVLDRTSPDIIIVPHRKSGQTVKVRDRLKNAKPVAAKGRISPEKYDVDSLQVSQDDVHLANVRAWSGEQVAVKRNFTGAEIVDVVPAHQLIGQIVKNEHDFAFHNAYPDPEDPEIVVVTHMQTGEDVRLRKTFDKAAPVDDSGAAMPYAKKFNAKTTILPAQSLTKKTCI